MFEYESIWDLYEMKFIILFISIVLAILLGNYLYKTKKNNKDNDSSY